MSGASSSLSVFIDVRESVLKTACSSIRSDQACISLLKAARPLHKIQHNIKYNAPQTVERGCMGKPFDECRIIPTKSR